jgi:hypothetical protein
VYGSIVLGAGAIAAQRGARQFRVPQTATLACHSQPPLFTMSASNGSKRHLPILQLNKKKAKLAQEFEQLAAAEQQEDTSSDLAAIVQYLIMNPEKTKQAKIAVLALSNTEATRGSDHICPTYIYVSRMTKAHLIVSTLPKMDARLTPELMAKMCKHDLRVDLKLLYFSNAIDNQQKIMCYYKPVFDEICVRRHLAMQSPLKALQWQADGSIRWSRHGLYRLMPEMPDGTDPKAHKFTKVKCIILESPGDEALDKPHV